MKSSLENSPGDSMPRTLSINRGWLVGQQPRTEHCLRRTSGDKHVSESPHSLTHPHLAKRNTGIKAKCYPVLQPNLFGSVRLATNQGLSRVGLRFMSNRNSMVENKPKARSSRADKLGCKALDLGSIPSGWTFPFPVPVLAETIAWEEDSLSRGSRHLHSIGEARESTKPDTHAQCASSWTLAAGKYFAEHRCMQTWLDLVKNQAAMAAERDCVDLPGQLFLSAWRNVKTQARPGRIWLSTIRRAGSNPAALTFLI